MRGMNSETVDLIYLDPPFKKQKPFKSKMTDKTVSKLFEYIDICRNGRDEAFAIKAESYLFALMNAEKEIWMKFDDAWYLNKVKKDQLGTLEQNYPDIYKFIQSIPEDDMKAYMIFMAVRIIEMHRVLKNSGTIYLHCDYDANSYIRILLDLVFRRENMRNEIVWCYKGAGNYFTCFPRKSDTIYFYTKSSEYTFYPTRVKYSRDNLGSGLNSIAAAGKTREEIKKAEKKLVERGKAKENWWDDIPAGGHMSKHERIGYPTQKPTALLERIIKASTNESDIVFDPFAGCATSIDAAYKLNRRWVACDISYMSVILLRLRLEGPGTLLNDYPYERTAFKPPERKDGSNTEFLFEEHLTISASEKARLKDELFGNQRGKCLGCGKNYEYVSFQMDHIIPKALNGNNLKSNFQLLCGPCNQKKGDRPESECRSWMWKFTGKIYYH